MRANQARIMVRLEDPARVGRAGQAVAALGNDATGAPWRLVPFAGDGGARVFMVIGQVGHRIGTPEHAKASNEAALLLKDAGVFSRVEADLPVPAFGTPEPDRVASFGQEHQHRPGTQNMRWAHDAMRVREAWALPLPPGGRSRGEGIRIGHPDSGYTDHPRLGMSALDLASDRDVISEDEDARDPLVPAEDSWWPFPNPGHGTSTASVIVGRGIDATGIVGVAPAAKLVPIRATESVIQLFDSDVAQAVEHARTHDCHVVSMSLGGKGFFGLEDAIERAVNDGLIVMAAAGNKVGFVTAPASYEHCIAVAGVGIGDTMWSGSSRGDAVDVSAPAECVHVASFDWSKRPPARIVDRSHGTSFAVTHLAGVAALWLAHHGRAELIRRYGKPFIQDVFIHLVCSAGSRRPAIWDERWGCGIVDAERLLRAPLPARDAVSPRLRAAPTVPAAAQRIAALLPELAPQDAAARLEEVLGASGRKLERRLERFEGELVYLVLSDEHFRELFVGRTRPAERVAAATPSPPPAASGELASLLASG